MKNILLLALTFGSIAAHALTPSKNYTGIYVNENSSVTVVEPRFFKEGEGYMSLSAKSDVDGVCKLYGFESSVENSLTHEFPNIRSAVRIDDSGKFQGIIEKKNFYVDVIGTVTCHTAERKPVSVSKNFLNKIANDDGSVTIVRPRQMMMGQNMTFTMDSDFNGVCKLYGHSGHVENSPVTFFVEDSVRKATVNSLGESRHVFGGLKSIHSVQCN